MSFVNNGRKKVKVLIAGIAGASLGTEILKSLLLTDKYIVYGCDVSNLAYGHYQKGFERTFIVNRENYIDDLVYLCSAENIQYIIPGAEEVMVILDKARDALVYNSIIFIGNTSEVINTFSNKEKTFNTLSELGFTIPHTIRIRSDDDLGNMSYPAVVKPSIGSGGSSYVYFVQNKEEAKVYIEYLIKNEKEPILQEYIPENEGEYTVGVLNLPNGDLVGSIALRRVFTNKLSIMTKSKSGLISSGNSQGVIDRFPDVEYIAESISLAINSKGPVNIQGRVKNGLFIPFEINPRFSASTYLRSMAGFNEIDIFMDAIIKGVYSKPSVINHGYYLRSFSEIFISKEALKND